MQTDSIDHRTSLALGGLALASLAMLAAQQLYVVARLGAGAATDAYFVALGLPAVLTAVLTGPASQVMAPLLCGLRERESSCAAWSVMVLAGAALAAVAAGLFFSRNFWLTALAPGLSEETSVAARALVGAVLLSVVLSGQAAILTAVSYARGKVVVGELANGLGIAAGLVWVVLAISSLGAQAAAWSHVVRWGTQVILLLPLVGLPKQEWSWSMPRELWRRARPVLLGSTYAKLDMVVDRVVASFTPVGDLTLLLTAQQVHSAILSIVGKSITAPVVPVLGTMANFGDREGFWSVYRRTRNAAGAISMGLVVLLVAYTATAGGLPSWLLGGRLQGLPPLLWCLSGMLVGGALGQVASTAFYASGNTRVPSTIAIVGTTVGVVLKIGGLWLAGVVGMACATSGLYLGNAAALMIGLERGRADGQPAAQRIAAARG